MQFPGVRQWMQQHVSIPLLFALALSALVHVVVLSEVDWRVWLSHASPDKAILQARLMPAVVRAAASPAKAPVAHARPQVTHQPPAMVPATAEEPESAIAASHAPPPVPAIEAVTGLPADDESLKQAALEAWHASDRTEPAEEDGPAPPYQHVITDFEVYVNGEARPAGSAKIEYLNDAPNHYRLLWQIEGRGLLKLLYPSLEQKSEGEVGLVGLKPRAYRYAFGQRAGKTYEAAFDWENNAITLKTSKGEQSLALPPQTQDILSFMYQFMFVPPLQEMRVTLTNGRRLGEYEYAFEGEDSMVIADRTIQTIHIAHTRGDSDEKTELWLATDYRYVPVKIKKLEKNGMVIEQVATRLIAE